MKLKENKNLIVVISLLILVLVITVFIFTSGNNLIVIPTSFNQTKDSDNSNEFVPRNLVFIGDSGTGDQRQFDTAKAIENYCKQNMCDSMEILGDVIYSFGVSSVNDEQFQTKFEKPYQNLNLPIYIAFGNHDYYGCADCYLEYAKVSNKFEMPAKYYTYKNGDIEVFVIDSEKFNATQQEWLTRVLKESSSKFKIVTGHRPLLTYDIEHMSEPWDGNKEFMNIICQKVDLYIAGHAHLLEDNGKLNNCSFTQLISGGGGATTRKVAEHPKETFNYSGNGFLVVFENKDEKIEYKFFDINGNVLRNVVLN